MGIDLVNGANILRSGVIVSNGLQSIGIRPFDPPGHSYLIEIVFEMGEADKPVTLTSASVISGHFRITVQNYAARSFGTTTPINVANHNNQRLMMSLTVTTTGTDINAHSKTLAYTIYYGGPVNVAP